MHELGIVFHVIKTIEEVAEEQNLTKVSSVTLEVGEVSTVIVDYLEDCWDWACKKSELMAGSKLKHEIIKGVTFCEDCGKTYETVKYAKICPYCQSENTYLIQGNEVQIKEIEAQ
ncbi:MAG: hydrogenase maturation nickel metallochaperone HypA [Eubacterium sp.]|nr:hydrogenase maturation nickel metallochaperone HypA [Eubacterium sp.]